MGKGFDCDVIVIGSGFGGSVAAFRATEKGYKVGILAAGKRWPSGLLRGAAIMCQCHGSQST